MPDLKNQVLLAQLNNLVETGRQALKEYKRQLEQTPNDWESAYNRGYNRGMNRVLTSIENILDNQEEIPERK